MGNHNHNQGISGRNLLLTTILNLLITVAEIIGGIISNSLALLSDALHNASDTLAILISFFANRIAGRNSNERKTFGYKRIEILAAFINSLILVIVTFFLFYEAIKRFGDPEPIKGQIMFIVAGIGLLANILSVLLLRKGSKGNINIRSAYIHLIGDSLSSVAVIISGILIYYFEWYWVDPVITIAIGIYILIETWAILKESVDILMQATPKNINIENIKRELEKFQEIDNIHHIHVWNLNDNLIHLECHINLTEDEKVSRTDPILKKIESLLHEKFNIKHVTIQFEFNVCKDTNMVNSEQNSENRIQTKDFRNGRSL